MEDWGSIIFIIVMIVAGIASMAQKRAERKKDEQRGDDEPPIDLPPQMRKMLYGDEEGGDVKTARPKSASPGTGERPVPPGRQLFDAMFGTGESEEDDEGWQPVAPPARQPRGRRPAAGQPTVRPARARERTRTGPFGRRSTSGELADARRRVQEREEARRRERARKAAELRRRTEEERRRKDWQEEERAAARRGQHAARPVAPPELPPRRATPRIEPQPAEMRPAEMRPAAQRQPLAAPRKRHPALPRTRDTWLFPEGLSDVRRAIVFAEILGPPRSMKESDQTLF